MKIKPAMAAMTAAAAAAIGVAAAPFASADDVEVQSLGQPAALTDGNVVQHWTITGLKPSTDSIPYRPIGTLWEATATDEAIAGGATPIVSNLNARAKNGDTYRVLFGVATPQGVNPSTLAQGEKTTGKIYFDVTGATPDSVVYNAGGNDLLLWVAAAARAAGNRGRFGGARTSLRRSPVRPSPRTTPATPTPGAEPSAATPRVHCRRRPPRPPAERRNAAAGRRARARHCRPVARVHRCRKAAPGRRCPRAAPGRRCRKASLPAPEAAPATGAPPRSAPEGSSGTPLPAVRLRLRRTVVVPAPLA